MLAAAARRGRAFLMFEKSTSDARPYGADDDTEPHRCLAGRGCSNRVKDGDDWLGALTADAASLCESCTKAVAWAVDDMAEIWLALHLAIGDQSRRNGQKVAVSRSAPINLNTDVDATKVAIVEWLIAAAARIAEGMNVDDPRPVNNTDAEHARVVAACTRLIGPNVERLLALGSDNVTVWLSAGETEYPGERFYVDENGVPHHGTQIVAMSGVELALTLRAVHRTARSLLALTTPQDKLSMPCPGCNEYELIRSHRTINTVAGETKEIDQIDCGACQLSWPYERYQQLCLIWVKEDEMEREKLQKALDTEKARREFVEWLLAKREWQFGLALECTDVSAAEFAKTVLSSDAPDGELLMSDKDIAALIGVSESTVRSWASRGHIERHTDDDGATVFLAREVWEHAKTQAGGRASTVRRLANERKAAS